MRKIKVLLIIILTAISLKAQETIPFSFIEEAPTFTECNGSSNLEKKKCLNKTIQEHIKKNLNTGLANKLGLTPGKKRVFTNFKIDTDGRIIEIIAGKAPHPSLAKEAIRVIEKIPKMIPGKQRGKLVRVSYVLPIVFNVDDDK